MEQETQPVLFTQEQAKWRTADGAADGAETGKHAEYSQM